MPAEGPAADRHRQLDSDEVRAWLDEFESD